MVLWFPYGPVYPGDTCLLFHMCSGHSRSYNTAQEPSTRVLGDVL